MSPHQLGINADGIDADGIDADGIAVTAPDIREADPLFRREMRERWRRPLTLLQLAVFALVLALMALGIYATLLPQGEVNLDSSLAGSGRQFFTWVARLHALAWIPGGLLLAAPTLAVERERGHLSQWLLAGLTPRGIALAKFRALAGFVLVMVCVPFPIFALCFPLGGVAPGEFAATMALTIAVALAATTIGLMISAQAARVTSALGSALVMSACLLPVGGSAIFGLLEAPWPTILAFAALFSLLPPLGFGAAVASFASGIRADLQGEMSEPAGELSAPLREIGADAKALMQEIAPTRPATAATPSGTPVRRDLKEAPPSSLEAALLKLSRFNALAHRDLRGHFHRPRTDWSDGALHTQRWLEFVALWVTIGILGLALKWWWPPATPYRWFGVLTLTGAMALAALSAAPAFARERAQRTLTELQLTTLSSLDIVVGKWAAALLICAQFFVGPLLALCLMALSYGPVSALMTAILGVCCAAHAAAGTLLLSLWGRKTQLIAGGALAVLGVLWLALPYLYIYIGQDFYFRAPVWLEMVWLKPFRQFAAPASDWKLARGLAQLALECALGALTMLALCAWQLKRTRADDENSGILQRDLTRISR